MAKNKTVYVLTTEEGTKESFTTIGALNKFAGFRTTKADLEAGKVPNVEIVEKSPTSEVEDQATLALEAEDELQELIDIAEATDNVEIIMVGDAPKAPVVEEASVEELAGDIEEVLTNTEADTVEEAVEELTNVEVPTEEDAVDVLETAEEPVSAEDAEQLEYPEVGHFENPKDLKKYVKGLSNEALAEWCELEGATFTPNDHVSINRMRMAMAMTAVHFPELAKSKGSTKKKAKYAEYSLEDLAGMAIDNDVEVPDAKGDPRIERMYLIVALRKAGLIS